MQLLVRVVRTFRQLLGTNGWPTLAIAASAFVLEVLGRKSTTSDWHDLVLAAGLLTLIGATIWWHQRVPLPWLQPVGSALRGLGRWLQQWAIEIGYDLRMVPPVKRGLPPLVWGIGGVLLVWGAAVLLVGDFLPQVLRTWGTRYFYLGYLALMCLLWGAMLMGLLVSFYFLVGLIHDELSATVRAQRSVRGPLFLAFASCLILAGQMIPLWWALLGCLIAWGMQFLVHAIPGGHDVCFLWRPRGSVQVRSVSLPTGSLVIFGFFVGISFNLVLTATGSLVWKHPATPPLNMPVTVTLGSALGWVLLAVMWVIVWHEIQARWRSPGRVARRILHVHGPISSAAWRRLRRHFPRRYWRIDHGTASPDPCAVQIRLTTADQSTARELDPEWPLCVSLDDLDDPMVRERLVRRSDIQGRRRLIDGLERMFKVAKRRKYRNGHGFWLAPHRMLWNGLRRDEPEPEPFDGHMVHDNVGPPYHRALPHLSRHLAHRVFRSLSIDLIFVEDSVAFRPLARVLRRIFELHDKQPGRPAEDLHFTGLHGTKVLLYDFQFDNPFESKTYPEPKFTALGRARILLVFHDRNESEEFVEPPFDFSRSPAPIGLRG